MKSSEKITSFRKTVFDYYKTHGRNTLPWRKTTDSYKIMVSEMMLQQTQVPRVVPFYTAFIKKFPTLKTLATAPFVDVFAVWQGLGYNSRAKRLHLAVQEIVKSYRGKMPQDAAILESLPGIGSYTARAISAFAYNHDSIFIETNIRAAVIRHFFPRTGKVSDEKIARVLKLALPEGNARQWYSALMDYGSYLKREGFSSNGKVAKYRKQSTFAGSKREARGIILKSLLKGPRNTTFLIELLGPDRRDQMRSQIASLTKEGLIELKANKFQLPR